MKELEKRNKDERKQKNWLFSRFSQSFPYVLKAGWPFGSYHSRFNQSTTNGFIEQIIYHIGPSAECVKESDFSPVENSACDFSCWMNGAIRWLKIDVLNALTISPVENSARNFKSASYHLFYAPTHSPPVEYSARNFLTHSAHETIRWQFTAKNRRKKYPFVLPLSQRVKKSTGESLTHSALGPVLTMQKVRCYSEANIRYYS